MGILYPFFAHTAFEFAFFGALTAVDAPFLFYSYFLEEKTMKKLLAFFLATLMLLSLLACNGTTANHDNSGGDHTDDTGINNDITDDNGSTNNSTDSTNEEASNDAADSDTTTDDTADSDTTNTDGTTDDTVSEPTEDYSYLTFDLMTDDTYVVSSNNDLSDAERENVTHVIIPAYYKGKRVTKVADWAFYLWTSVQRLTISEGIEEIGSAFSGMNIQELTIPEGVKQIGNAFQGCSLLKEITLPKSPLTIQSYAFSGCPLEKLYLSDIGAYLSSNFPSEFSGFSDIYVNDELLTELVVPANVKRIGSNALSGYKKIEKIDFEENSACEYIGDGAFAGCDNLTSVRFPNSLLYIGTSVLVDSEYMLMTELLTLYNDYYYVGSDTNPYLACIGIGESKIEKYSNDFHPDMKVISDVTLWQTVHCDVVEYRGGYYMGNNENPYRILVSADPNCTLHPETEIISCAAFRYFWGEGTMYILSDAVPETFAYAKGENNHIQTVDLSKQEATPLIYELNEDSKGYTVTGILSGTDTIEVYIPDTHEGLPVTAIGDGAFANSDVVSVYIPDSVMSIGAEAFYACESLTDLMLGDNLFIINRAAFRYCRALKTVNLPNSVAIIEYEAFADCDALSSFSMSENIMKIGSYVFRDCPALNSQRLGSAIIQPWLGGYSSYSGIVDHTIIAENAFNQEDSEKLTWITIPNSVKYIGAWAFDSCTSLNYYEYGGGKYMGNQKNPYLVFVGVDNRSVSSFELHKDTQIICYRAFKDCANLESVTIPEGVVSIGYEAFAGCSRLKTISIPNSVEFIDDMAFFQCANLENIEIGKTIILGDKAFWWCIALDSIEFRGTIAEWESIYKYENWYGNTILSSVICEDGIVTLDN